MMGYISGWAWRGLRRPRSQARPAGASPVPRRGRPRRSVSMCRWYSLTSFSDVPRGSRGSLGRPTRGLDGRRPGRKRSSLRATPVVETSATVHSRRGFASGTKGIRPGSSRAARAFMICRVAKSTKRYESMAIKSTSTGQSKNKLQSPAARKRNQKMFPLRVTSRLGSRLCCRIPAS
jgi:hypothetical protein